MSFVDRAPGEQDRWHGPRLRLASERSLRRLFRGDLGSRDRVVADNGLPVLGRGDEYAR